MKAWITFLLAICSLSCFGQLIDYRGDISFDPVTLGAGDSYAWPCRTDSVASQRIEASLIPDKQKKVDWTLSLATSQGVDSLLIKVVYQKGDINAFSNNERIAISVYHRGECVVESSPDFQLPLSRRAIYLKIYAQGHNVVVMAGDDVPSFVGSVPFNGYFSEAVVSTKYGGTMPRYAALYEPANMPQRLFASVEEVMEVIKASTDPFVAAWQFLDEDVETDWAVKGGAYILATVPAGNGNYTIVYLDRATAETERWQPGAVKGVLIATPFLNNFTLRWVDSAGVVIDDGSPYATIEGALLTLVFPLEKARLRFARMPR